jgi:SH3-like domain-containing protein
MCKKIIRKSWIMFILLVLLSLACSSQVTVFATPAPPNVETLVAGTLVVLTENAPKITNTSVPTLTSVPASATPDEFGGIYVYTTVENVNLRTNPGTLFTVSRVMPQGTRLQLLGRAPGSEWLNVQNDEGVVGWVNVNVLIVAGSVLTESGTPVSGIGFAVYQGSRRTDAMTNADGQFYAFLPPSMSGVWTVEYASVACTSNTMDSSCNCIGGRCGSANPASASVQLPQVEPLGFVWK